MSITFQRKRDFISSEKEQIARFKSFKPDSKQFTVLFRSFRRHIVNPRLINVSLLVSSGHFHMNASVFTETRF